MVSSGQARRTSFSKLLIELVLAVVIISAAVLIASAERNNFSDWLKLRNYSAPAQVVQLANQDTMTAYARKLFYVNHPQIDSKTAFASVCPNGTEQTVVLGCYHSGEDGIYVLDVNNSQLAGIIQVTAAHETLHAIYEQLSSSARSKVDKMLLDYYKNGLSDPAIKAQIAAYRKSEPNGVTNEMHSLFGTEVANLPPGLEAYYAQYFTDRQAVVSNYQSYQAAFTSRQQQLTSLSSQISTDNSQLSSQLATIQSDQRSLEQEKANNQIVAYNQGVPGYNQLVNQYNSLATSDQSLVNQYNSIALEEQQLLQAISSSTQTISN